jgi:putative membrane protein
MSPEIQAFAIGFPTALAHAGTSLVLLILGCAVYGLLSPHREFQAARDGDGAAAVVLAGVVLSLGAPLALSLHASAGLAEVALWGAAVLVVQLLVFRLVDLLMRGLPARVAQGDIPSAVLLSAARLATALILAAAVAG